MEKIIYILNDKESLIAIIAFTISITMMLYYVLWHHFGEEPFNHLFNNNKKNNEKQKVFESFLDNKDYSLSKIKDVKEESIENLFCNIIKKAKQDIEIYKQKKPSIDTYELHKQSCMYYDPSKDERSILEWKKINDFTREHFLYFDELENTLVRKKTEIKYKLSDIKKKLEIELNKPEINEDLVNAYDKAIQKIISEYDETQINDFLTNDLKNLLAEIAYDGIAYEKIYILRTSPNTDIAIDFETIVATIMNRRSCIPFEMRKLELINVLRNYLCQPSKDESIKYLRKKALGII